MKIADLAAFVLNYNANNADSYPVVWSSYEAIESLKIVDKVKEYLSNKYEDDLTAIEDGMPTEHAEYLTLSRDYKVAEVVEALDKVYTFGLCTIDYWLEENDAEYSEKN